MSKPRWWIGWAVCVGICILAGGASALLRAFSDRTWYESLRRPSWMPPDAVFGPVWTLLYVMMGSALWLVRRSEDRPGAPLAVSLFAVQLVLNVAWSPIFFGLHRPGWAIIDLAALWVAVVATMLLFWSIRRLAGLLLTPYLLWCSFAAALNFAFWQLNR